MLLRDVLLYNSIVRDEITDCFDTAHCLDDSKIRLSLPKPFRILLKLWKVVENIRLPFPVYLLYLFARLVAQRDF